ncbi:type II secretion system F family protein [Anaerovorax odorimutans]|uniref:type II secretion system F family protein n=1 Tax=Anaerovorax odorimutans TaxID=109327 RepID=UPI00041238A4|nr:type II secretion system F family protein [Anaerovorax odorimutans]
MQQHKEAIVSKTKPFSSIELSIFCEQVAMIIQSGMLIYSGLQMITDDTKDMRIKRVLQIVSDQLADNNSFDKALSATGAFPSYMIHMAAIGTETGKLDIIMQSLSKYYNQQHNMKEMIKSAVIYPAILIVMMLIVLIFLMVKVIPVFENVFHSLGMQISPSAAYMIKIGNMLNNYSFVFLIILCIIGIVVVFLTKTQRGNSIINNWISQRKFSEKFSISAFASSMSIMISSGIDTEQSLKLSLEVISNVNIKSKINNCINLIVNNNKSFVNAFECVNIFSNTTMGILSIGSKSGNLNSAMDYIADIYENEYQYIITKNISLIEPISVTILSILIGSILISIMLPLLSVMSSIA